MKIEKATEMPDSFIGRPSTYPFRDLLPGFKLSIPCEDPDEDYFKRKVGSALYQYKKSNHLRWKTAVRLENGEVCVYRIS